MSGEFPWHHGTVEITRVDRWLHAVRLVKTRSGATDACRAGHVRVGGKSAKPSTPVRVGDRIETTGAGPHRVVEVTQVIDKRVGAAVAADCYIDHSPAPPRRDLAAPVAARDRGAGRPTKRDRRQLDRLRGRR